MIYTKEDNDKRHELIQYSSLTLIGRIVLIFAVLSTAFIFMPFFTVKEVTNPIIAKLISGFMSIICVWGIGFLIGYLIYALSTFVSWIITGSSNTATDIVNKIISSASLLFKFFFGDWRKEWNNYVEEKTKKEV